MLINKTLVSLLVFVASVLISVNAYFLNRFVLSADNVAIKVDMLKNDFSLIAYKQSVIIKDISLLNNSVSSISSDLLSIHNEISAIDNEVTQDIASLIDYASQLNLANENCVSFPDTFCVLY